MNNTVDLMQLPQILEKEILAAEESTWDFFYLFLSEYYNMIDTDPTVEIDNQFNNPIDILVAYNVLFTEVTNGGFLQLINNGYGNYIFCTEFSNRIRKWGAVKTASNLDNARQLYLKHELELEAAKTQDPVEIYNKFPCFNSLDHEFFQIMDLESEGIKLYIKQNINYFAVVA